MDLGYSLLNRDRYIRKSEWRYRGLLVIMKELSNENDKL
jgi:hypothetical protein